LPSFKEHINQARKNLTFLVQINNKIDNYWDWQVTVAFYSALHIIDGHVSKTTSQHYRSHEDIRNAINPYNEMSPASLDEESYKSYEKLFKLSRRSRYLINEKHSHPSDKANFTFEKHFAKAIRHLDKLMVKFNSLYSLTYPSLEIKSLQLKQGELSNFKVI
jgi:hypothetical protein